MDRISLVSNMSTGHIRLPDPLNLCHLPIDFILTKRV